MKKTIEDRIEKLEHTQLAIIITLFAIAIIIVVTFGYIIHDNKQVEIKPEIMNIDKL